MGALTSLPESHALPSVQVFAECTISSTQQRASLPSVTLGKTKHSAKQNTRQRDSLPSVGHSAKKNTRQTKHLPSAFLWHSAKYIYLFFFFALKLFLL
jgi:hypothetical protein